MAIERVRLTSNLAAVIPVCAVYLFILGLVGRLHVPIEAVLQSKRVVLVFYPLELLRSSTQCASRMDEM